MSTTEELENRIQELEHALLEVDSFLRKEFFEGIPDPRQACLHCVARARAFIAELLPKEDP